MKIYEHLNIKGPFSGVAELLACAGMAAVAPCRRMSHQWPLPLSGHAHKTFSMQCDARICSPRLTVLHKWGSICVHCNAVAGGFSEALVREMMSSAGLTLDIFDSSSLRIIKQIEQEDGSQTPEDFEVFMAIAGKE